MFKNFIASLTDAVGISVIATKVENQLDIDDANELGIDLFQGWFVSKTENLMVQFMEAFLKPLYKFAIKVKARKLIQQLYGTQ